MYHQTKMARRHVTNKIHQGVETNLYVCQSSVRTVDLHRHNNTSQKIVTLKPLEHVEGNLAC